MLQFSILTLNVGLLDVEILGRHVIEPAPYVNERLYALPQMLMESGADVIALQEIYRQEHREFLIHEMKRVFPYHEYRRNKRPFHLEDSLMFFSKYPLIGKRAVPFKVSSIEEELFVFKGVLIASVMVPDFKEFTLYNAHTTAGGVRDPQNKAIEKIRSEQLRQIIEIIHKHHGGIKIIVGDLNTGPEVSRDNYELLISARYIDTFDKKHGVHAIEKKTWEPANILNIGGPHRHCPPQRIDHIFVNRHDLHLLKIVSSKIIFDQPCIAVGGKKVTVSDHYGLITKFAKIS